MQNPLIKVEKPRPSYSTQNTYSSNKLHIDSENLRETAKVLRIEAARLREISRAVRAGEYA
jgi:hypothetical protein